MEQTGDRYYEAELHRQRGELLLLREAKSHAAQGSRDQHEAETCFQHALDVARQQQAKSFELRAAISLGRGFDTADLQEAKTLLEELA